MMRDSGVTEWQRGCVCVNDPSMQRSGCSQRRIRRTGWSYRRCDATFPPRVGNSAEKSRIVRASNSSTNIDVFCIHIPTHPFARDWRACDRLASEKEFELYASLIFHLQKKICDSRRNAIVLPRKEAI